LPKKNSNSKRDISRIIQLLKKRFPNAECTLNYENPLQLLIATILSAQCTDARVNIVTKSLFQKYRRPEDFVKVKSEELEKDIRSTGFYRNKAKNIQGTCKRIIENFEGKVPETMEDLLTLPGVARKTANVVLGNAYGLAEGVVVDTHVQRISKRLGLTEESSPQKIEVDLMRILPRKEWIQFSHLLILHGRTTCKAIKPLCSECAVEDLCPKIGVKKLG
jgi:endonuclease-3